MEFMNEKYGMDGEIAAKKMGAADIFPLCPEGISGDQYLVLKPAGRLGE